LRHHNGFAFGGAAAEIAPDQHGKLFGWQMYLGATDDGRCGHQLFQQRKRHMA
jgi:hypothetical protein